MLPATPGLDHHAHAVADLGRADDLHRGAEVGDIRTAAQPFGQRGLEEIDHQLAALLAHIDSNLAARKAHEHTTDAIGATAEVHILQRQHGVVRTGGEDRLDRRGSRTAQDAGAILGRGRGAIDREFGLYQPGCQQGQQQ